MKRTICVVFTVVIMLSIMGCQKTPEKEVVVSKDGKLEEIVESLPIEETIAYTFPQNHSALYEATDKLSVDIDASIQVPANGMFPVYAVTFSPFSEEQASALIDALYGDATVYKEAALRSKAEIEAEIINFKRIVAEVSAGNRDGDLTELEKLIAGLEAELAAAPDSTSEMIYDGTMSSDSEGSFLKVYGNIGKAQDATLEIRNYETSNSAIMLFTNGNEYWVDGEINEQADGLSSSPDDALEVTSQWLEKLGMSDFRPIYCRVGSTYQSGDIKGSEGYVIVCERHIEDMPITYNLSTNGGSSVDDMPDFSKQFNKEKLTFTVDDTGVTTIKWENPISYAVKNENVPLINFEDMLDYLLQGVKYKYAWMGDPNHVEGMADAVIINISQIKLGLAVVPEKDNIGNYMLVPAWDFFGTESSHRGDNADVVRYDDRSFVTINAIDGSIIE